MAQTKKVIEVRKRLACIPLLGAQAHNWVRRRLACIPLLGARADNWVRRRLACNPNGGVAPLGARAPSPALIAATAAKARVK